MTFVGGGDGEHVGTTPNINLSLGINLPYTPSSYRINNRTLECTIDTVNVKILRNSYTRSKSTTEVRKFYG